MNLKFISFDKKKKKLCLHLLIYTCGVRCICMRRILIYTTHIRDIESSLYQQCVWCEQAYKFYYSIKWSACLSFICDANNMKSFFRCRRRRRRWINYESIKWDVASQRKKHCAIYSEYCLIQSYVLCALQIIHIQSFIYFFQSLLLSTKKKEKCLHLFLFVIFIAQRIYTTRKYTVTRTNKGRFFVFHKYKTPKYTINNNQNLNNIISNRQ